MNPFENINIPNNQDGSSIECWSDLMTDINQYFEETWRYLNKEDTDGILSRLWDDINSCHLTTRTSFSTLNNEMFKSGMNLVKGGIWEEYLLPQLGVNKANLINSTTNFPDEYTFRTNWDWVIFSDMNWNPIINYNKTDATYSKPWMFTQTDSIADNIQGSDYVLSEAILQKQETDEANNALDNVLKEGSIQIDDLENPEMQESISRLYWLALADFQKALQYFTQKSDISLFHQNPTMNMLSSWDFQLSVILNSWEHHIVNFHPNWEVESEHTF